MKGSLGDRRDDNDMLILQTVLPYVLPFRGMPFGIASPQECVRNLGVVQHSFIQVTSA